MNKRITSSIIFLCILFAGCSPKLGKQFYRTQDDIQVQQWGNYLPNDWRAGVMSDNYPGVFAIVNEEIVFDAQGPGSKPWMKIIGPFKIMKSEILDIELSKELAFGRKILTVQTTSQSYSFFLMNADDIFKKTREWLDKDFK